MTEINIRPIPRSYLDHPVKWRPMPPPIYQNTPPEGVSQADRKLAYELFKALDPESQAWYRYNSPGLFADIEEREKQNRKKRSKRKK